ncbi:MAG: hydroxymethylbilane synthase, partial [Bacteroidota bacterium]
MTAECVRIGTRGSDLALWQAAYVERELLRFHKGLRTEIVPIRTTGDVILNEPLERIGDKGLFTRAIELALLDRRVDLAVHSLKDLPTEVPAGLVLGAVTAREDARDVFIPHPRNPESTLLGQRPGARIATGSLRRRCQLLHLRPDVAVEEIRGNLATRFRKLEESAWAGMILARAGVVRLGWEARVGEVLDFSRMLPAVGQGALAVQVREGDVRLGEMVRVLHDVHTGAATAAERALLAGLEGGCQVPVGALAVVEEGPGGLRVRLEALLGSLEGDRIVRGTAEGDAGVPEEVGRDLAERLLAEGGEEILREVR